MSNYLDSLSTSARRPLFVILHSIDSPVINAFADAQPALAALCACKLLRVVLSIRTPRAALLWSESTLRQMRLYNLHMPLLEPVRAELVHVGRRRTALRAATRRSAQLVLASVPRKTRSVFAELARALLARRDEPGVPISTLFDACHGKFLVRTTGDLRQQLVEFRTHNLVGSIGSGFNERLTSTLPAGALKQLILDVDEINKESTDNLAEKQ